jgi:hypothetical protein
VAEIAGGGIVSEQRVAELEAVLRKFVTLEWGDDDYIEDRYFGDDHIGRKCFLCESYQDDDEPGVFVHADSCPYVLGRKLLGLT